ncbi:MAG: hypothetical protein KAR07_00820, partial [Spirochaetes bacterium]|nr:hypothetical protein [Spirochaetota bacterium]
MFKTSRLENIRVLLLSLYSYTIVYRKISLTPVVKAFFSFTVYGLNIHKGLYKNPIKDQRKFVQSRLSLNC